MAFRQNSEFPNIFYTVAFILFLVLISCVASSESFWVSEALSLKSEHTTCVVSASWLQVEVLEESNDEHRNLKIALIKPSIPMYSFHYSSVITPINKCSM